nr:MAG TPA: hypothetical protein [Bacteriophage sp.]
MVRECYLISKFINTSYLDAMKMAPIERKMVLEFIKDELEK